MSESFSIFNYLTIYIAENAYLKSVSLILEMQNYKLSMNSCLSNMSFLMDKFRHSCLMFLSHRKILSSNFSIRGVKEISYTSTPTTRCNFLGTFFPLDFTRILAYYESRLSLVSSSTVIKHPQASPSLLKNCSPQKCKGNPNTPIQTSLTQSLTLRQPTSGFHQSNRKAFPSSRLFPRSKTLFSSQVLSNLKRIRDFFFFLISK